MAQHFFEPETEDIPGLSGDRRLGHVITPLATLGGLAVPVITSAASAASALLGSGSGAPPACPQPEASTPGPSSGIATALAGAAAAVTAATVAPMTAAAMCATSAAVGFSGAFGRCVGEKAGEKAFGSSQTPPRQQEEMLEEAARRGGLTATESMSHQVLVEVGTSSWAGAHAGASSGAQKAVEKALKNPEVLGPLIELVEARAAAARRGPRRQCAPTATPPMQRSRPEDLSPLEAEIYQLIMAFLRDCAAATVDESKKFALGTSLKALLIKLYTVRDFSIRHAWRNSRRNFRHGAACNFQGKLIRRLVQGSLEGDLRGAQLLDNPGRFPDGDTMQYCEDMSHGSSLPGECFSQNRLAIEDAATSPDAGVRPEDTTVASHVDAPEDAEVVDPETRAGAQVEAAVSLSDDEYQERDVPMLDSSTEAPCSGLPGRPSKRPCQERDDLVPDSSPEASRPGLPGQPSKRPRQEMPPAPAEHQDLQALESITVEMSPAPAEHQEDLQASTSGPLLP